jgi:FkbM family methyltransferase
LDRCGPIQTKLIVAYFPRPEHVHTLTSEGCTPQLLQDIRDFHDDGMGDFWLADTMNIFDRFFSRSEVINNGVVFEVGADNGKVGSSHSFFFEKLLGWQCLLIEAHPLKFGIITERRPGAIRVPTALCPAYTEIDFAIGGVGSVTHSNNQEMATAQSEQRVVKVPCTPLSHVLKAIKLTHIDVWILDVEGFEQQVLEGMDWNIPVKVIQY